MKKFLLSLFVGFIGFISFGYCDNVVMYNYYLPNTTVATNSTKSFISGSCMIINSWRYCGGEFYNNQDELIYTVTPSETYTNRGQYCFDFDGYYKNTINRSCEIIIIKDIYKECQTCEECETCEACPEIDTGAILSGYILESSIDTNYCVGNGLCPNACGSGTDYTGDLQFSNIFINNILHPGRENIFIDIPDYIYWDYSVDTGDFNLYVGSGYDQDYIDGILSINTYKPSSEDFTQVFVSGLTLIFPYIFVALFIIFVWKLLKRIFK